MTAVVSIFGQPQNVLRRQETLHFALATSTGLFEVRAPEDQTRRVDLSRPVHLTGALHIETDATGDESSYIRLTTIANIQHCPAPADHFRMLLATAMLRPKACSAS
jgi:hypothetical protein